MTDKDILSLDDARREPDPEDLAPIHALFQATRHDPGDDFFDTLTRDVIARVHADAKQEDLPPNVIQLRPRQRATPPIFLAIAAAAIALLAFAWWLWPASTASTSIEPEPPTIAVEPAPDDAVEIAESDDWRALGPEEIEALDALTEDLTLTAELEDEEVDPALYDLELEELEALSSVLDEELY